MRVLAGVRRGSAHRHGRAPFDFLHDLLLWVIRRYGRRGPPLCGVRPRRRGSWRTTGGSTVPGT